MPAPPDTPFHDPMMALAFVAGATTRIRLATGVLVLPMRNPFAVAKAAASLDVMSGGRFIFGIGIGWLQEEFEAIGAPYEDRARRTREYIALMKELWTSSTPTYRGRLVSAAKIGFAPKPVQQPHPPILVGAFVPRALDRAARLADGFTGCCAPVDALISMMGAVREAAREHGRDPAGLQMVMRCLVTITPRPVEDPNRPVAVGSWEQIREDVIKMRDAGVDEVFFDLAFQPDNTDRGTLMRYLERFRGIAEAAPAGV